MQKFYETPYKSDLSDKNSLNGFLDTLEFPTLPQVNMETLDRLLELYSGLMCMQRGKAAGPNAGMKTPHLLAKFTFFESK